jgi:hypothetical protein
MSPRVILFNRLHCTAPERRRPSRHWGLREKGLPVRQIVMVGQDIDENDSAMDSGKIGNHGKMSARSPWKGEQAVKGLHCRNR